jgi:RimJ/RimL family protein N-acetyltransferase
MVHAWFTYWLMVIKDIPFGAGLIGFKGFPDTRGETEVGYGIDEYYRSRGYTTEALSALCAWAFKHPECRVITAKSVVNPASMRLLQKSGWEKTRDSGGTTDWETRRK